MATRSAAGKFMSTQQLCWEKQEEHLLDIFIFLLQITIECFFFQHSKLCVDRMESETFHLVVGESAEEAQNFTFYGRYCMGG